MSKFTALKVQDKKMESNKNENGIAKPGRPRRIDLDEQCKRKYRAA